MCDAARIAREVVKDRGDTPEEVLACIAKGLGFTHISLSRTRVMEGNILAVLTKLPAILTPLIVLIRVLAKRYGWLLPILKKLLELKKAWDDVMDLFDSTPPSVKVESAFGDKCKCKPIEKRRISNV
jgi:hypothetical protein